MPIQIVWDLNTIHQLPNYRWENRRTGHKILDAVLTGAPDIEADSANHSKHNVSCPKIQNSFSTLSLLKGTAVFAATRGLVLGKFKAVLVDAPSVWVYMRT